MVNNQNMTKLDESAIIKVDMDRREFKITIGIRSYWITQEELNKYMAERVQPGVEYVVLRDGLLILPIKFQEVVHRSVIADSEEVEQGRWQCTFGRWHTPGHDCLCNVELIDAGEGMVRLEQKVTPALESPKPEEQRKYARQHSVGLVVKPF